MLIIKFHIIPIKSIFFFFWENQSSPFGFKVILYLRLTFLLKLNDLNLLFTSSLMKIPLERLDNFWDQLIANYFSIVKKKYVQKMKTIRSFQKIWKDYRTQLWKTRSNPFFFSRWFYDPASILKINIYSVKEKWYYILKTLMIFYTWILWSKVILKYKIEWKITVIHCDIILSISSNSTIYWHRWESL